MNSNISIVHPGEVQIDLWCSVCKKPTDHLFDPNQKTPLKCLICFPELDPRKEGEK